MWQIKFHGYLNINLCDWKNLVDDWVYNRQVLVDGIEISKKVEEEIINKK